MRRLLLASTVLVWSFAAHAQTANQITPDSGTLTDSQGNVWTISTSGSIQENGQWTPGGGGTSALTIGADGTVYGLDNGHGPVNPSGWFSLTGDGQSWAVSQTPPGASAAPAGTVPAGTSPTTTPSPLQIKQDFGPTSPCVDEATGVASTGFHVAGGQIIGPNGKPFIARGVNLYDGQMSELDNVINVFKGINFIRVNIHSYDDPSTYSGFIQAATGKGIVVEFENHPDAGGGQDASPPEGLAAENAWYAAMAAHFKSNPYVWFGTFNEPKAF